jgi:hypothetical protein
MNAMPLQPDVRRHQQPRRSFGRWGTALLLLAGVAAATVPPVQAQEDGAYQRWLEEQERAYADYLNEQDRAFASFLERQWRDVPVRAPSPSPLEAKPSDIPRAEEGASSASEEASSLGDDEAPGEEAPTATDSEAVAEDAATGAPPQPAPPAAETVPPEATSPEPAGRNPSPTREPATGVPADATGEASPLTPEPSPSTSPAPPPAAEEPEASEGAAPASATTVALDFLGSASTLPLPRAVAPQLSRAVPDAPAIQAFWADMAKAPYGPTLDHLKAERQRLGLDDWGYYLYVRDAAARAYPSGGPERVLWTWFVLIQSGYDARVAHNDTEAFLLLPVDARLYRLPQMRIDGRRYYLIGDTGRRDYGRLRTYEGTHPKGTRTLHLDLRTPPALPERVERRTVRFHYQKEPHELELTYDRTTLDYLDRYPHAELGALFASGVSRVAQAALAGSLRPLLEGRSLRDALNLLMRFVQIAFPYKVDAEHFGEERFLTPEQTLASPFSDCEDRAVLLGYLVRTLLDLEVVGLRWPDHVALAVRWNTDPEDGDAFVTVEGEAYLVADPTYMGADAGMLMPYVADEEPTIITLAE